MTRFVVLVVLACAVSVVAAARSAQRSPPPAAGAAGAAADDRPVFPFDDSKLIPAATYEVLLDHLTGTKATNAYVSDFYPDYPTYDSQVQDDFVVDVATQLHFVETYIVGWNGFQSINGATGLRVDVFTSASMCGDGMVGDVLSLSLALNDPRVSFARLSDWQTDKSYYVRVDISGLGVTVAPGRHRVTVALVNAYDTNGDVGVAIASPQDTPRSVESALLLGFSDEFAGFNNPAGGYQLPDPCVGLDGYAAYRVLGRVVCPSASAVEFVCPRDASPKYHWCVLGTPYTMQCAPGSGCVAGVSATASSCSFVLGAQHSDAAPACGGQSGHVCDASHPNEYYVCAETFRGWQPCAPGTTCKATAGTVVSGNPCW